MSKADDAELEERLRGGDLEQKRNKNGFSTRELGVNATAPNPTEQRSEEWLLGASVQWATSDDRTYRPMSTTRAQLKPGMFRAEMLPNVGLVFMRLDMKHEFVLNLPDTPMEAIADEIGRFWARGDRFKQYGLAHKRGILLWGDPGGGKSFTIMRVMQDVIARGGIGLTFNHPSVFAMAMEALRQIQPETPVVVLMEDIDSIVENFSESDVLNILDGAQAMEHVVFLASTNYPERLGARIVNRPSRFDKRFKIGLPSVAARRMYIEHMVGAGAELDVERWARDTDGLSFAHMKELFVTVHILGNDYAEALETLKRMGKRVSSSDSREHMGFGNGRAKDYAVEAYPR